MMICGCFLNTSANEANSAFVYTEPLGLHGVLKMKALVFGVIAASNCSAVILKFCSAVVLMKTGVPSANLTISG